MVQPLGGNDDLFPSWVGLIGAGALALAIVQAKAQTQPTNATIGAAGIVLSADEILRTIVGKTCTTKVGAKFTFTGDGHYNYDGLWANQGHYVVNEGAVTVLLDSGLEREFAISRKGDVYYIEETAISCS